VNTTGACGGAYFGAGRRRDAAYRRVILLYKGADDAQSGQAEVFEGPGLGCGVEEGVQEERDVSLEEELSGRGVRRDALEERERIAHAVGCLCIQLGRMQLGVDQRDLLHRASRVGGRT
jgi:hypothetical protein